MQSPSPQMCGLKIHSLTAKLPGGIRPPLPPGGGMTGLEGAHRCLCSSNFVISKMVEVDS